MCVCVVIIVRIAIMVVILRSAIVMIVRIARFPPSTAAAAVIRCMPAWDPL